MPGDKLTKQDQTFVEEVVMHGNQTEAAKKAYGIKNEGYARLKGHRMITKDNIVNAVKSYAELIPDELLKKTHLEGLKAGKKIFKNNNATGEIEEVGIEPDYATRHKYLDSGYKLKGLYAPEKHVNLNLNGELIPDEELEGLAKQINDATKSNTRTNLSSDGVDTDSVDAEV